VGLNAVPNVEHPNILDYDALKPMTKFEKDRTISVVCSNKAFSKGHRNRLLFVQKLRKHFGAEIDVYGKGLNEVRDKWDAIARYRYHVVLENCSRPDYWSEKLSDAYLAGAYPFYYGCSNILDYFPKGSLTPIDITAPEEAISMIIQTIQNNEYERSFGELIFARNLVLDKYNLFAFLAEHCNNVKQSNHKEIMTLRPEHTSWRSVPRRMRPMLREASSIAFSLFWKV